MYLLHNLWTCKEYSIIYGNLWEVWEISKYALEYKYNLHKEWKMILNFCFWSATEMSVEIENRPEQTPMFFSN